MPPFDASQYKRCSVKVSVDDADKEAVLYMPLDRSQPTLYHLNENFAIFCCVSKPAAAAAIKEVFKSSPALQEVFSFTDLIGRHFHDLFTTFS